MGEAEQPIRGRGVPEPEMSEDDRRAAAAATNRKRVLEEWERNKKLWRKMGVPAALPAKK